ncbi:cytochrome P450 family protein [Allokutzneria albata]|uniref:cytochrome P450 n=1 Tax=Allokutzneria albata TaxID=211114 RepID=UPI0004C382DB|nr:cytochrome P450 [Allokutzneria albata]
MLAAEPDGDALTDEELVNGHETTKTPLVNTVLCLAEFPETRDDIPRAVEEVLRFLPPVGGTDRFTTRPTTIAGHRFEARRTPNKHRSFGNGVHFCLGAHLAHAELTLAASALTEWLPGLWDLPADQIALQRTPVGIDVLELVLTQR